MTITYELNGEGDTTSAVCSPATEVNEDAKLTQDGATDCTFEVAKTTTDVIDLAWTTSAADGPGDSDWPSGDYVGAFEVTTGIIPATASWKIQLLRVNSSCTIQQTLGTSASKNGTGANSYTVNTDPSSGATSDLFQMRVLTSNTAHQNANLTIAVDDTALSYMEGPWTASSNIAGTADIAISGSATLKADGKVSGDADIAFDGSGTMSATGVIAGTSAVVVSASGSLSILPVDIAGTSAVVVSTAGTLKATGVVAGTSAVVVSTTGTLEATGVVAGTSAVVITASGTLEQPAADGDVAGTSSIVLTAAGAVSATGSMAGASSVAVTTAGVVSGSISGVGTSSIAVTTAGALQGAVLGAGTSSIVVTTSGAVLASAALSATSSVVITVAGQVVATAVLAGSSAIVFTASGTLFQPVATLAGTADIVFSAVGALSNQLDRLRTVTVRRVLDISSGDKIRVRVKRTSGTDVVRTAAQGCDISAIGPI